MQRPLTNETRPLACPLCQHQFGYQDYFRSAKTCPGCKAPLGMTFSYRMTLFGISMAVAGLVMYLGFRTYGQGWLLLGPFVAVFAGVSVQAGIMRNFPPKLQAYAEGATWIKLS